MQFLFATMEKILKQKIIYLHIIYTFDYLDFKDKLFLKKVN